MIWRAFYAICFTATLYSLSTAADQHSRFSQTHSRSQYVHWITLYDANNRRIDPTDPDAAPYSPLKTCRRCHDYDGIANGHHFNAHLGNVPAGRAGEPWIWTDDRTGTQIPLSARGWEGTYKPEELGLSPWDFVLKFGRHLPGGGPGQPEQDTTSNGETSEAGGAVTSKQPAAKVVNRWNLSGRLDIDCMFCHSHNLMYSPEIWWDQIEDENFAWAPTAASGLGFVEGKVSSLPDDFDPATTEADSRHHLPKTTYAPLRIDAKKKVFIDVIRHPDDNACYYCHSTRKVGRDAVPEWLHDEDVHLRVGMSCSDCHRNGIQHHTVRGYEGEQHPSGQSVTTLSCRGCHMGVDGRGGRLGAPKPLHKGLPALHLDRLACTTCHSGPHLSGQAQQVQTALAHGLGLPSHNYTAGKAPAIVAPVLMQDSGKLYPHRMMWPAFWGKLKEDTITPLNPMVVYEALRRVLRVRRGKTLLQTMSQSKLNDQDKKTLLGEERARIDEFGWTEKEKATIEEFKKSKGLEAWNEKLAEALEALKATVAADGAQPVYVGGGNAVRMGADGKLEEFVHPAAEPYAWKLAHDVRPARASIGVDGCSACHTEGTPIFAGEVTAISVVPKAKPITHSMAELAGYDKQKMDAWNVSFQGRPLFKVAGFLAMGIVGLGLLAYPLVTFGRGPAPQTRSRWSPWEKFLYLVAWLGVVFLSVTSFGGLFRFGEVSGWTLFAHMVGAGMFVFMLPVLAITWCGPGRFDICRVGEQGSAGLRRCHWIPRLMFWIMLAGGLVSTMTMLLSMLPLFGTDGLGVLLDLHYFSGLVVIISLAFHCSAIIMQRFGKT